MRSKTLHIDTSRIRSFKTILSALRELETLLPQRGLTQFMVFNKAYYIVTAAIQQSAKEGYFANPIFIEEFTVCFAKYYVQAVNDTAASSKNLPFAWKSLSTVQKHKNTPEFIYLLMGANAHISHDLPLALTQLMDKKPNDNMLQDVFKIDKLLMRSGREIISTFDESHTLLDFIKRRCIFFYYRIVMYMVLYWRIKAWHRYKAIKKDGLEQSNYEKYSIKVTKRLLHLTRLFQ